MHFSRHLFLCCNISVVLSLYMYRSLVPSASRTRAYDSIHAFTVANVVGVADAAATFFLAVNHYISA